MLSAHCFAAGLVLALAYPCFATQDEAQVQPLKKRALEIVEVGHPHTDIGSHHEGTASTSSSAPSHPDIVHVSDRARQRLARQSSRPSALDKAAHHWLEAGRDLDRIQDGKLTALAASAPGYARTHLHLGRAANSLSRVVRHRVQLAHTSTSDARRRMILRSAIDLHRHQHNHHAFIGALGMFPTAGSIAKTAFRQQFASVEHGMSAVGNVAIAAGYATAHAAQEASRAISRCVGEACRKTEEAWHASVRCIDELCKKMLSGTKSVISDAAKGKRKAPVSHTTL